MKHLVLTADHNSVSLENVPMVVLDIEGEDMGLYFVKENDRQSHYVETVFEV